MREDYRVRPWQEVAARLVGVAAGRQPADTVVRGTNWVNVQSGEVLPGSDIAMACGRFAFCGPDAGHCIGESTEIVDGTDLFALPGFCDGHMHVESGMLTPSRFAEAVIPHGTTSMFVDPHEIANVMGLEGVRLMHDEAVMQPVNMFVQMPSCVPSAPGLETPGASISPEDVREAMTWPGMIGLGEMMNFSGVIGGDDKMLAEIAAAQDAGKTVGGHYASPDLGRDFHTYAAAGPADDHEGTREEDAIARVRQGMRAMLRLGSAWYDVERQITAVTERGLDSRNFILCTDDCHTGTLVADGHMNRVVRHAIECGCDPVTAIQMATVNTATHFGLERELGSIAPGRRADLVFVSDLETLSVLSVYARGRCVARDGRILVETPSLDWPDHACRTVRLGKRLTRQDFGVRTSGNVTSVVANVIGVVENQAPTRALKHRLTVSDGMVNRDQDEDICHLALVERHRATGSVVNGFVKGFGYRGSMAIASTIAHDSHHMVVVGTDREEMARAANRLGEVHGGVTLWIGGREAALIGLPVAGLMADRPAAKVAAEAEELGAAMVRCGCDLNNAFMQHSLLSLAVIPELRISDLGILDSRTFEIIDLFDPE